MEQFVVTGATGRVGSTVADELLARGKRVTVIVRDHHSAGQWSDKGAVVAQGSLDDASFVAGALQGADGFFALLPENVAPDDFHGARRRMADTIAASVRDSRVPHVVLLSGIAAVLPDGNGPARELHYLERQLISAAAKATVLRACYFQDNVARAVPAAMHAGIYPNLFASADLAIPMIATRDVGRFAAEALLNPPNQTETVDLFGPSYSIRQVATILGRALGREVTVVDIPAERQSDTMVEAGVPRVLADAIAEMFAAFNSGAIVPQGDRRLVGTTTIDEVVPQYV
jgi:uncharacterized protein YbjT (DUF2867 family)